MSDWTRPTTRVALSAKQMPLWPSKRKNIDRAVGEKKAETIAAAGVGVRAIGNGIAVGRD